MPPPLAPQNGPAKLFVTGVGTEQVEQALNSRRQLMEVRFNWCSVGCGTSIVSRLAAKKAGIRQFERSDGNVQFDSSIHMAAMVRLIHEVDW